MNLEISHVTRYSYDREVQLLPHLLYVRPRENAQLRVNRFSVVVAPDARVDWMRDDLENLAATVTFPRPAASLEIHTTAAVTTADTTPFGFLVSDYATTFPFTYAPPHRENLSIYLKPPGNDVQATLRSWLDARCVDPLQETVPSLVALNQAIHHQMRYERRDEPGIQNPLTTLRQGSGSCRDLAVLLVAIARTLGLAARFVSGYAHDPAADAGASGSMHAWAEVFLPGAGWIGVDPTQGIFCHNAHIPAAHAVVAESINPVQGAFRSATAAGAHMASEVRVWCTS